MSHISGNERLNEVKQNLAMMLLTKSVAENTEKLREAQKLYWPKLPWLDPWMRLNWLALHIMVKEVSFAASFVQSTNTKTVPPPQLRILGLSGVLSYETV